MNLASIMLRKRSQTPKQAELIPGYINQGNGYPEVIMTGKRNEWTSEVWIVFRLLNWMVWYMGEFTCENSSTCTFMCCTLLCMYLVLH